MCDLGWYATKQVETIRVSDSLNVDIAPDATVYGVELLNADEQLQGAMTERCRHQRGCWPTFGDRVSDRRVLEIQARLLARVVTGERSRYPGFETR